MFSLKMKKLLITLVMVMVVVLALGSVKSLATQITVKAPENTVGESTSNNNTSNTNTNTNNAANNTNNNTNTNKNAVKNNTSAYNNTKTGSLPYAGTNTSVVFVVIAFVASSLYAYKKVSDYNI